MADGSSREKPGHDSTKLWLEQRRQKASGTAPFTPHTPPTQRSLSTFSSPGSILGKEEDAVIIELDPRCLSAGTEGESGPQCRIAFGPESCRRLGDHRMWLADYNRRSESLETWGHEYELWRNDVADLDTGLLSDVLERTIREAYNKHLLMDAGAGRMVLVLPSLVPHPVIETILTTLFKRWKYPSITLLPRPAMAIVSAGLRSGLVVDIGWEETVITSIYEYREVGTHRSTKAMKLLTKSFATILRQKVEAQPEARALGLNLDLVEEVLVRAIATLRDLDNLETSTHDAALPAKQTGDDSQSSSQELDIVVPLCSGSASCTVKLSQHELINLLSAALLGGSDDTQCDDHETPLPQLIFRALLFLSPDLRGVCLSRIVFIGLGSASTALRRHILKQTESLIHDKSWTTVRGRHLNSHRSGLSELAQVRSGPPDARHNVSIPAEKDYVEEKLQKQKAKANQPIIEAALREIHTLGPWAGASLLASLKIRGFVEIERDRFLSHGFSGASRDSEISVVPQTRLVGFGFSSAGKPSDRTSWTLGGWG